MARGNVLGGSGEFKLFCGDATGRRAMTIIWDKEEALSRMRGRVDRLMMLLEMFPDETLTYMSDIEQAILAGDQQQLRMAAHALKGVAGTLSAHSLQEAAEGLEMAATTGASADIASLHPDLQICYSEFSALIRRELEEFQTSGQNNSTDDVPVVALEDFIRPLIDRLQDNDYVDPAELSQISYLFKEPEKAILLESLRVQISTFNNEAAVGVLTQIAASAGVILKPKMER